MLLEATTGHADAALHGAQPRPRSISPGRSDYRGYPSTHPAGATQSMSHAGQTTMVHVFQKPIVGNPAKKPKMTVMGSNGSVMTTIGESASVR